MIEVRNICPHCGISYMTDIDAKDKPSLCPSPNCYGKKKTCDKCDQIAKYTQPDKETGEIIDVCDKHFIFMYMG